MPSTIRDLSELTTPASNDYVLVSDTSDVVDRDKKMQLARLALKSGTPVAGRLATWLDANTIQGGSVLESDISGHIAATTSVHGATGSVVGTTNAQLLLNKTIRTVTLTISDDSVATYDTTVINVRSGFLFLTSGNTSVWGQSFFRASGTTFHNMIVAGVSTTFLNTALTGTSGTDGRFTVGVDTNGILYFENRIGSAITVTALIVG